MCLFQVRKVGLFCSLRGFISSVCSVACKRCPKGKGQGCKHRPGVLRYRTIQACSFQSSGLQCQRRRCFLAPSTLLVRTIVIGMLGALGKMNLTSSNFPRRRQVSARDTLTFVSGLLGLPGSGVELLMDSPSRATVVPRSAGKSRVSYACGLNADLSPSPCAMITVAVCFFSAGAISACLPAMFSSVMNVRSGIMEGKAIVCGELVVNVCK